MLKKIWSSIPQFSLIILILSLLKNFLYYFNFNVPIKYFIGLSELGLLVAGDLLILVPMFLLMYVMTVDTVVKSDKKENEVSKSDKTNPTVVELKKGKGWIRKVLDKVMPVLLIIFLISLMIIAPIYYLFQPTPFANKLLFGSFLVADLGLILFVSKHEVLESILTSDGMLLSLFSLIFGVVFVGQTANEIESVENGKYKGTKITTSDSTYTSTDSSFYIGQTANYIFFYDMKDKHTTILPIGEIKKLELYSK